MSKPPIKSRPQKRSVELTHVQNKAAFEKRHAALIALQEEVVFILSEALTRSEIKIHQIESRVKTFDSISKKISGGSHESLDDIVDLVGARVICLFKSDLSDIDKIINESFDTISSDDKIESSSDTFGYMSVHYVCKMKTEYAGPRYDKIREEKFEIQVRTLCMHAWAAISHYLDYKADWDIPDELKKGLNALSGLFYVADVQYEQLYASRQASREEVRDISSPDASNQPINLDTVQAMLRRLFSDRISVESEKVSIFVRELIENGYSSIGKVELDILGGTDFLNQHDEDTKRRQDIKRQGPFFADLGAARVSLKSSNKEYKQLSYLRSSSQT